MSLRSSFRGLYRLCQCGCGELIPIINKLGRFARFKKGHSIRLRQGRLHPAWKGTRYFDGDYWFIYKPYFKYSYENNRTPEHRYIYHIYLSILNNKIVYIPKDMDVHHFNGIKTDNRVDNLVLKTHSSHTIYHNLGKKYERKDYSDVRCLQCGTDKTYHAKDGYYQWHEIEGGYLCSICFNNTPERREYKRKNKLKNYWKKKNVTNSYM